MAEPDNSDLQGKIYDDLGSLKDEIKRAAIEFHMHQEGWEGTAEKGFTCFGYRSDFNPTLPGLDHGPTGVIELTRASSSPHGAPETPAGTINPWEEVYQPWVDRIDRAFRDWDGLPQRGKFDDVMELMYRATNQFLAAKSDDGYGSVELDSSLTVVEQWVSPDSPNAFSGSLIFAFHTLYGSRLRPVIANQGGLMTVLGAILAGENDLWAKARHDVTRIALEAKRAFEYKGGQAAGLKGLAVFKAALDLVISLIPAGTTATRLTSLLKGTAVVESVLPTSVPGMPENPPELAGDTPDVVFDKMVDALDRLADAITATERELDATIDRTLDFITTTGPGPDPRANFHMDPGAGLNPGLANAPGLDIKVDVLKDVGFQEMPQIAAEIARGAQLATGADQPGPWYRPAGLGFGGATGPYDHWHQLLEFTVSLVLGSADEIVAAGDKLAAGAGFLEDTDGLATQALGDLADDVAGAGLDYAPPGPRTAPDGQNPSER